MSQSSVEKPSRKQMTPEQLAKLAVAREKALETRKRNAELRRLERLEAKEEEEKKYKELKAKYDGAARRDDDDGDDTGDGDAKELDVAMGTGLTDDDEEVPADPITTGSTTTEPVSRDDDEVASQDYGGATYGEIIKKAKMKRPRPESGTESSSSEEEEEIVVKRKKKSSSKKKKRRIVYVEASSSEDESPHPPQPDDEAMSPLRPWGHRGYFAVRR